MTPLCPSPGIKYSPFQNLYLWFFFFMILTIRRVFRLIGDFGNKMQICTQRYGKRPYGVGLLVAGYDDKGAHIYQTCPSANFYGERKKIKICQVI